VGLTFPIAKRLVLFLFFTFYVCALALRNDASPSKVKKIIDICKQKVITVDILPVCITPLDTPNKCHEHVWAYVSLQLLSVPLQSTCLSFEAAMPFSHLRQYHFL
jgi:hypothetical protein